MHYNNNAEKKVGSEEGIFFWKPTIHNFQIWVAERL